MSTNAHQTHAIMEVAALTWSIVIPANVLRDMMVSTATTVRLRVEGIEVFMNCIITNILVTMRLDTGEMTELENNELVEEGRKE